MKSPRKVPPRPGAYDWAATLLDVGFDDQDPTLPVDISFSLDVSH